MSGISQAMREDLEEIERLKGHIRSLIEALEQITESTEGIYHEQRDDAYTAILDARKELGE